MHGALTGAHAGEHVPEKQLPSRQTWPEPQLETQVPPWQVEQASQLETQVPVLESHVRH